MLSWLTLFAAALAIWFVLKSSAATMPSWILRACRVVIAFFLYSGFLYLLKWNPLWKLLSVSPESRNRVEGFLHPDMHAHLAGCNTAYPVSGLPFPPPSALAPRGLNVIPRGRRRFGLSSRKWPFSTTSSLANNSTDSSLRKSMPSGDSDQGAW